MFLGVKQIDSADSKYNGRLVVKKDLAWGKYIQANGITQSGGVAYQIWKTTLGRIKKLDSIEINKVLILGLGGGSISKIVRKNWPNAGITGVEIDKLMVDLGKKYLDLEKSVVKIVIGDAYKFVIDQIKKKNKYDLVCVDVYLGSEFPKKFEEDKFLKSITKILSSGGGVVFNRLYYDEKRTQAVKFGDKLEKIFNKVDFVYPEANLMYICRK